MATPSSSLNPTAPLLGAVAGLHVHHNLATNTLELHTPNQPPVSLTPAQTKQLLTLLATASRTLQETADARFFAQHSQPLF